MTRYVVVSTDAQQRIVNILACPSDLEGTAILQPKLTAAAAEAAVMRPPR